MWRMRHRNKKMGNLSVKTPCWKFSDKHALYKIYPISQLKDNGLATPVPLVLNISFLIYYYYFLFFPGVL